LVEPPRPKAREGLLAADHSKRGRRFVTIVDRDTAQVTLLEPWEHAILILTDGTRTAEDIAELLAPAVDDQAIDVEVVARCHKFFEREGLIHGIGLRRSEDKPPGPRTMAEIQQAYREWHKEPVQTGHFPDRSGSPFIDPGAKAPPGLEPTIAMAGNGDKSAAKKPVAVGSTLVLAGMESLLGPPAAEIEKPIAEEDSGGVLDVLEAVDSAVAEADALEAEKRRSSRRFEARHASPNAALSPTMVAAPPTPSDRAPRLLVSAEVDEQPTHGIRWPEKEEPPEPLIAADGSDESDTAPKLHGLVPQGKLEDEGTDRGTFFSQDKLRTVSTGSRPEPKAGRALLEKLRALGEGLGKRGRKRSFEEVLGLIDPEEAARLLGHFRALHDRLPRSRRIAGFAAALAAMWNQEAATSSGPPPKSVQGSFLAKLDGVIEDAVIGGRCPACLSRVGTSFSRCSSCGFSG